MKRPEAARSGRSADVMHLVSNAAIAHQAQHGGEESQLAGVQKAVQAVQEPAGHMLQAVGAPPGHSILHGQKSAYSAF